MLTGHQIRSARLDLGLTQAQFGKRAGVSRATISRAETWNGHRARIDAETEAKIRAALKEPAAA